MQRVCLCQLKYKTVRTSSLLPCYISHLCTLPRITSMSPEHPGNSSFQSVNFSPVGGICTAQVIRSLSRTPAMQPFHFAVLLPHNIPLLSLAALFCSMFSQNRVQGWKPFV